MRYREGVNGGGGIMIIRYIHECIVADIMHIDTHIDGLYV